MDPTVQTDGDQVSEDAPEAVKSEDTPEAVKSEDTPEVAMVAKSNLRRTYKECRWTKQFYVDL